MEESVSVLKFAEARAAEIKTLMEDVHTKGGKLTLQRLPYHMRRRAASHNPKRLPRNLRKKAEENLAKPSKKKKRKNPKNLLEEYNSRKKPGAMWLPTHVWFAKRFHMKNMFGYQLPMQATGKRFRSSHRATVRSALLQDLSYFCCIELQGTEENILSRLSILTDDSLGMNFAAESFIDGTKEGACLLYHPHSFPFQAVGPVSFLWNPSFSLTSINFNPDSMDNRQLWIWCHPSIHEELIAVLVEVFNMELVPETYDSKKKYDFASKTNFMKTKPHFQKERLYSSKEVTMVILKDTLVRHRVIGPKASSILTSIFKQSDSYYNLAKETDAESSVDKHLPAKEVDAESSDCEKMEITDDNYSKTSIGDLLELKRKVWQQVTEAKSSYFVPMNAVIGLNVDDPRIYVTPKDSGYSLEGDNNMETFPAQEFSSPSISFSEIWNRDLRNTVTALQTPEHVINTERSKYVIPLAPEMRKCTSTVPVIVIYQPAVNGYGSGWDIIAPQGWGMAFWIPLIYHGAQPAGFDDYCCINLESGNATFPVSFPDTKAGATMEESTRGSHLKQFYRYSRAKRPNFKLLGISNPFFMPWKVLVNDWQKEFLTQHETTATTTAALGHAFGNSSSDKSVKGEFFTLRGRKEIVSLRKLCLLLEKSSKDPASEVHFRNSFTSTVQSSVSSDLFQRSLVVVRVKCLLRGTPFQFSGIYLPKELDLESLKENPKYFGPVESPHSLGDEYLKMPANKRRKILKEEAKIESKKLDSPDIETIISNSDYKLIGYVSEGGYSRLGGQGLGLGHCALTGFLTVIEICAKMKMATTVVLVREQHVFQYRPASIEVIENPF